MNPPRSGKAEAHREVLGPARRRSSSPGSPRRPCGAMRTPGDRELVRGVVIPAEGARPGGGTLGRRCIQGSGLPRRGPHPGGGHPGRVQGAVTLGRGRGPFPDARCTSAEAEQKGVDAVPQVGVPGRPQPPAVPWRGEPRVYWGRGARLRAPPSPRALRVTLATGLGPAPPSPVNRKWASARRALPVLRGAEAIVNDDGIDQSQKTTAEEPIVRA